MPKERRIGNLEAGQRFRIRARYDKGGYPIVQVREVLSNGAAMVQAYLDDGTPVFWGGVGERPSVMQDAAYKLAKYWRPIHA